MILILSLLLSFAKADPIRVALVDTGLDLSNTELPRCVDGHKDFTNSPVYIQDTHGHGTLMASIIKQYSYGADICFVVIKYFDAKASGELNVIRSNKALKYAASLGVDIINYSSNGPISDEEERDSLIPSKTKIVIAAGNEGINLNTNCAAFPVCYKLPMAVSVGNIDNRGKVAKTSNYGSFLNFYALGENVYGYWLDKKITRQSGTSVSTAKVTGYLISHMRNNRKYTGLLKNDRDEIDVIDCSKHADICKSFIR